MYRYGDDVVFLTIPEAAQYLNVTEDTVHGFAGYCYIYCRHLAYECDGNNLEYVSKDDPKYLQGIVQLERNVSFGYLATWDQRWHDEHSADPTRPCEPKRHDVHVWSTRYMKCDGRRLTDRTRFGFWDYYSTIVEAGLFYIKDLDKLAIQHGFEQRPFSTNTDERNREADDTPEGRSALYIQTPTKKDDWFYAIKECAEQFLSKHSDPPTETELWIALHTSPPPNYPITLGISSYTGKSALKLDGVGELSRDALRKRYKNYFPPKTT